MSLPQEVVQAQTKLIQLNQRHEDVKEKINAREFEENRAKLTLRELDSLPENRLTYKRVGTMFLLTPCPALKQELTATIEKSDKELTALRTQQKHLEAQVKEAQKTLQEMMFLQMQS
ncbi:MAG: prefoldin subunit [archaeon]|nr:prefoldin subunit [archaeon]